MIKRLGFIVSLCIALAGCSSTYTYNGLRLISPGKDDATTNTRPTFTWEAAANNAHYDFAIWECMACSEQVYVTQTVPVSGKRIYYRENLTLPEHTIDVDLTPSTWYLWSARERNGEKVGEWASYNQNNFWWGTNKKNFPYELLIQIK